jgi:hypothetical protein
MKISTIIALIAVTTASKICPKCKAQSHRHHKHRRAPRHDDEHRGERRNPLIEKYCKNQDSDLNELQESMKSICDRKSTRDLEICDYLESQSGTTSYKYFIQGRSKNSVLAIYNGYLSKVEDESFLSSTISNKNLHTEYLIAANSKTGINITRDTNNGSFTIRVLYNNESLVKIKESLEVWGSVLGPHSEGKLLVTNKLGKTIKMKSVKDFEYQLICKEI